MWSGIRIERQDLLNAGEELIPQARTDVGEEARQDRDAVRARVRDPFGS
jgi:hypothetical protein